MTKPEPSLLVVIKEPLSAPHVDHIPNTLQALQAAVGGYIESFTVDSDLTILCNEEGLLRGLPFNATICGNPFVGTVVAVGVRGDEFCSIPSAMVPRVLRLLKGDGAR